LTGTNTNANTIAGNLQDSSAAGAGILALGKSGAGTWNLSGSNTYTGATIISGGSLQIGAGGTTGSLTATASITNNANLTINRSDAFTQAAGLNDKAISGTGSFTQAGGGTTTLSLTNTYTGATNVTGGTLLINGSTSSTSLVTVGVNGTLGGTGTVGGNTTISGIHSPGNSPGIQTFTGNLSYVDAGTPDPTVNWELASSTTTVGVNPTASFDQIIVGGNLDFTDFTNINLSFNGAGSTVLWSDSLWSSNQSWLLYDVTGTTANFANLNLNTIDWLDSGSNLFSTAGGSFTLGQSGEDVMLNYSVIPEPDVAALIGGLGFILLLRRRR
jgi:fibronectin-binding autotransporter adhesin